MTLIEKTVIEIKGAWGILFGDTPSPTDATVATWILQYGYKEVKGTVARAGRKFRKMNGAMTQDYLERYIGSVLSKTAQLRSGLAFTPSTSGELHG